MSSKALGKVFAMNCSYECDVCHKTFKTVTSLHMHKWTHADSTEFACSVCNMKFSTNFELRKHRKTHSEVRHRCEVCLKTFSWKSQLKEHKFTHMCEKSLKCEECNKQFRHPRSFRRHIAEHASPSFKCDLCIKSYRTIGGLAKHRSSHEDGTAFITVYGVD